MEGPGGAAPRPPPSGGACGGHSGRLGGGSPPGPPPSGGACGGLSGKAGGPPPGFWRILGALPPDPRPPGAPAAGFPGGWGLASWIWTVDLLVWALVALTRGAPAAVCTTFHSATPLPPLADPDLKSDSSLVGGHPACWVGWRFETFLGHPSCTFHRRRQRCAAGLDCLKPSAPAACVPLL